MQNKPELKPFDKVLVRDNNTDVWQIELFESDKTAFLEYGYACLTTSWRQCIPYEGNEHLLGTNNSNEIQEKVDDNYGYSVDYFKQNDVVLCRDGEEKTWGVDVFSSKSDGENFPFRCYSSVWKNCIPYDGNERLLGTADTPERYDPNKNTLFGVRLKPGYVLEFEDNIGILFPTANGFAVSYAKGLCQFLKGIKKDSIVRILGITQTDYLRSGELLWKRPQKQAITKAEIAEKLGMNVQYFEIIDEDNEENE